MISYSVFIFVLIELIAVGYIDFVSKRVSNVWAILNIVTFIGLLFILPSTYKISWQTFFYPMSFIIVGFMLFVLKIMGGGDSKFLSSLYLLIPVEMHESAFICLAYTTVMVGSSLLLYNSFDNFQKIKRAFAERKISLIKEVYGKRFSYAPVIMVSWIWFGWINRTKFY